MPSRHTHKGSWGASALGAPCVLNGSSHFDRPQPRKKSKHHGFSPKQNRPQRPLTAGDQPGLQMSPNLGDQVSHEFRLRGANSQLCGSHRAGVTQFPRASVGGGRARKTQLQPHTNHPPTPCSSVSLEPHSGAGRCWPVLDAAGQGLHFFVPPPQQAPPPGQSVCGEDMATRPGNTAQETRLTWRLPSILPHAQRVSSARKLRVLCTRPRGDTVSLPT